MPHLDLGLLELGPLDLDITEESWNTPLHLLSVSVILPNLILRLPQCTQEKRRGWYLVSLYIGSYYTKLGRAVGGENWAYVSHYIKHSVYYNIISRLCGVTFDMLKFASRFQISSCQLPHFMTCPQLSMLHYTKLSLH